MITVVLDGITMRLERPDIDGDGVTGGVERIKQRIGDVGIQSIIQPTELGDSLKELNLDVIEQETRMTGIDLRARLHPVEVNSVLAIDSLVALGVLPVRCLAFSRQKKRLSVSINGKGRDDIVNIVRGKRDHDKEASNGFGDKVKSFLGGGK